MQIHHFMYFASIIVCANCPFMVSADQDKNLRIEQRDALSSKKNENALIEQELQKERQIEESEFKSQTKTAQTADELGPALHLSVKQRQWVLVRSLLDTYKRLNNSDPMLVHYASGALARHDKDYDSAERHYLALLDIQSPFLPGELELARVWFEDKKNASSLALFKDILQRLPTDNPQTHGVRQTVTSFINALEYRETWQGSLSFGPTFNDNLNLSSEDSFCLSYLANGHCWIKRTTAKKKSAYGMDLDASLNRRISLTGHHGIQLRSFAYGTNYQNHKEHNQHTFNIAMGYSYQTASHQLSILPQYEYRALSNQTLHTSTGLRLDWLTNLTQNSALKFEVKTEYLNFRPSQLNYQSDWQWSVFGTYWHQLDGKWLVFGGVDWTLKQNDQAVHEYQLWGGRLGLYKSFASIDTDVTLFTSLRQRRYGDYNAMIGGLRDDTESNITLMTTFPELFAGFRPLIEAKYNHTSSSIDWLYSYDQQEYSIKLEKRF